MNMIVSEGNWERERTSPQMPEGTTRSILAFLRIEMRLLA